MKYAVILYDGMADLPVGELGGRTPMEAANKPNFDRLARKGEIGLVRTVADGLKPGSDVANLNQKQIQNLNQWINGFFQSSTK